MRIEKVVKSDKQEAQAGSDEKALIVTQKGRYLPIITSSFCVLVVLLIFFIWQLNANRKRELLTAELSGDSLLPAYSIDIKPYGEIGEDLDFKKVESEVVYAYNPATHQVFYDRNSREKVAIASITKLLTVIVSEEVYEPETILTAAKYETADLYWVLGLEEGDKMTFEDAVSAMMISSYNDVAFMVAQNYPGGYQAFIKAMNDKAGKLGMIDSNFASPSGLDTENHYSTARDLKKLVQIALENNMIMKNVSKYSSQIEIAKADGNVVQKTVLSTNQLLGTNPYLKGLKTGSTEEAGECFIGFWDAGGDDKLITILLNSSDRFEETEELAGLLRSVEYSK